MKALWNGVVIAESDDVVELEGNIYFPRDAVTPGVLEPSDTVTRCFWKGEARYYSVVVKGERLAGRRLVLSPIPAAKPGISPDASLSGKAWKFGNRLYGACTSISNETVQGCCWASFRSRVTGSRVPTGAVCATCSRKLPEQVTSGWSSARYLASPGAMV